MAQEEVEEPLLPSHDKPKLDQSQVTPWKAELLELRDVGLPACLANVCEYLPVIFMVSFSGHLGPNSTQKLDAVALGRSYFNFTALSVGYGAISATRTLFPQAIGSGNHKLCAAYAQRAIFACVVCFIPCALLQVFSRKILSALGQPESIISLSEDFVVWLLPTYFGWIMFAIFQRILQAYSKAYFPFIATIIMAALSPVLIYLFVDVGKYGYLGTAFAAIIYSWIPFILLVPYVYHVGLGYLFIPRSPTEVIGWRGVKQYLKLAIPGLLQICLEWWILEAVSLLAGILPDSELTIGASYIVLTLESLAVMGWLAVLVFNSVRVGLFIGAQNVASAKRAAFLGILTSLALSLLLSIATLIFRKKIPLIYTNDEQIVELTSQLLYVLAALFPMDALNNCMGGIMGGLGLQRAAAVCQFIGYYFIGMPVAIILVFWVKVSGNGVLWLWGGVALSMFSSCCLQSMILLKYDWNEAVKDAMLRIQDEKSLRHASQREVNDDELADSLLP